MRPLSSKDWRLSSSLSKLSVTSTNILIGDSIYLWDSKSGDILARPEGHGVRSNSVAWNPVNPYLFASVGDDGKLKV